MLIKQGEALLLNSGSVQSADSVLSDPDIFKRMAEDSEIISQFKKVAEGLKQIAPKAKDFLYFSAIMMHAAEASLIDQDGNLKKDAAGRELSAHWDKNGDSWRWNCSDPNVMPYRNSNLDIFPAEELIKAHKKWVGRPLCLDHKSSSVDMIRGVIVDTYYDHRFKRVIVLCALDKVNYPDLARKVSTGYATSVSMGTAVGKAICTDCGTVARIESDFCDHMRRKNAYGEINIDLNPIELSIVVNGADPKAKIRHIVAAANSIANYVSMKQSHIKNAEDESKDIALIESIENALETVKQQLSELKSSEQAEQDEQGDVPMTALDAGSADDAQPKENSSDESEVSKQAMMKLDNIESILGKLQKDINQKLAVSKDENMTTKKAYFLGGGGENEPTPGKPRYEKEDEDSIRNSQDKQMTGQMETGPVDGMHPGYESFGETEEARKKRLLRASVQERELRRQAALKAAQATLQKGAYFQGGGDVNEPTPGKPKYNKEDSDSIRDKEDMQMTGQAPFPGVGALDGLHPSPASADVKDELKRKQMLLRAKLVAKFIKAAKADGTLDLGESRWQVYADNKLILTATVDEITGKKAEALYGSVATENFGRELIAKIKSEGFEKAAALYKGAQAMGASPAAPLPTNSGLPTAGLPGDGADPLSAPGGADDTLDQGKSGDPKEQVSEIAQQLSNLSADLSQASEALANAPANELKSFEDLAGGVKGSGTSELPALASTMSLIQMQKKLGKALRIGIKELQTDIRDGLEELRLANTLLSNQNVMKTASAERKQGINAVVGDACSDARRTIAEGMKLMNAFVKYARGTQSLVKRAEKEAVLLKRAQVAGLPGIGDSSPQVEQSLQALHPADQKTKEGYTARWNAAVGKYVVDEYPNMSWDPKSGQYADLRSGKPAATAPAGQAPMGAAYTPAKSGTVPAGSSHNYGVMSPEERGAALNAGNLSGGPEMGGAASGITTSDPKGHGTKMPGKPGDFSSSAHAGDPGAKADDGGDDVGDLKVAPDGSMEGSPEEVGKALKEKSAFDLSTKEGRAAYRTKLAEKGLAFSDVLTKAHGKGGFTTQLDVKPTGDLAKVETLEERHKVMLDIANAPPKVRKQAEDLQKHIVAGTINPETDFPGLIANGVDPESVKYWKSFYGEAKDGGSQFGADLVKDYEKKKVAEEQEAYRVKVARAYALAHEMADQNLIGKDTSSVNTQVTEMLGWNDESFESVKKVVARQKTASQKIASAMPQVGLLTRDTVTVPAPEAKSTDMKIALDALFANRKF